MSPFALATGVRIPRPAADDGPFALSFGLTEIPFTAPRDKEATHYLDIALRTQPAATQTAADTTDPSVTYVFVVDTSGSMAGAKLSGAQEAMRVLFAEMRPGDALGIVDFDNQVQTVLPPTLVGELTLDSLNSALFQLVARGGTDLDLGLSTGISEALSLTSGAGAVNHVVLFSDGNPTDRVVDWMQIRANAVTAIGGAKVRVSTFAFGEDANGRELDALAGVTGGHYGFVSDPTAVGKTLAGDLARRDRLLATDVRLNLQFRADVEIRHMYGHDQVGQPISRVAVEGQALETSVAPPGDDGGGLWVVIPDLAADDAYWLLLEVSLPADSDDRVVGAARVTFSDAATLQPDDLTQVLTLGASVAKLPSDLVVQHAVAAWTSEVAFYTLDDLQEDDAATASRRLREHLDALALAADDLARAWIEVEVTNLRNLAAVADQVAAGSPFARQTRVAREALALALYEVATARSGSWQP